MAQDRYSGGYHVGIETLAWWWRRGKNDQVKDYSKSFQINSIQNSYLAKNKKHLINSRKATLFVWHFDKNFEFCFVYGLLYRSSFEHSAQISISFLLGTWLFIKWKITLKKKVDYWRPIPEILIKKKKMNKFHFCARHFLNVFCDSIIFWGQKL